MAKRGSWRELSTSAIISALVCLFALQSVSSQARDLRAAHGLASAAASYYQTCRPDPSADRDAPAEQRRASDQCCALCSSAGRDDLPTLLFAAVFALLSPSTDPAHVRAADVSLRPPTVAARSHSSRAPPLS
ncbi:DUF2946 family protein [Methylosinus sp. Sm6]|uniref:DUF2946 family protein n=1 Tax=Methylosinus sp. Sm6 TaxID=2866948 RepID=UPI00351CCE35